MSKSEVKGQQPSPREKFIASAEKGKVLVSKCTKCGHTMLETVLFCEKCSNDKFEPVEIGGTGTVVTYTIQAVAPEGFEDVESYAWVVFQLDDAKVRASGFMPGIKTPQDLPIGEKVKVTGFDQKHGLLLKKT